MRVTRKRVEKSDMGGRACTMPEAGPADLSYGTSNMESSVDFVSAI